MNKMFDYFASGRPIIANAKMGHSIIEEYNCGVELNTNDPSELADKIIEFYQMPREQRLDFGKRSREAANAYDMPKLCDEMVRIVKKVGAL